MLDLKPRMEHEAEQLTITEMQQQTSYRIHAAVNQILHIKS